MFYAANSVDRVDHIRKDEQQTKALWASGTARVTPYYEGKLLIRNPSSSQPAAELLTTEKLPKTSTDSIFLGYRDDIPVFAVDVSDAESPDQLTIDSETDFADLRVVGPLLNAHDGSMLAYARAMMHWQRHSAWCSFCGSQNRSKNSGHARVCTNTECTKEMFPRTDPAVIMLVTHTPDDGSPERCLLGRHPAWPNGVYSTLAGFVEPGETLEHAVSREVFEEAGVRTTDVSYMASQPWPFPQSIMLGFRARATTTEINLDEDELADAGWFTREELATFGNWGDDNYESQLPRPDSIARFLIDSWLKP